MNRAFPLGRALLAAALILGTSIAMVAAQVDHTTRQRALGVLMGAIVVVYANAIPKVLTAHARRYCSEAAGQAVRRFAGWSLVLGGIGYMLAFLLAPIERAPTVAAVLLGGSVLAALVRCLRMPGRPQT